MITFTLTYSRNFFGEEDKVEKIEFIKRGPKEEKFLSASYFALIFPKKAFLSMANAFLVVI